MALMVADLTSMDPKDYIGFINDVRAIQDPIEFKTQICLFLKNYSEAAKILSQGNDIQKN